MPKRKRAHSPQQTSPAPNDAANKYPREPVPLGPASQPAVDTFGGGPKIEEPSYLVFNPPTGDGGCRIKREEPEPDPDADPPRLVQLEVIKQRYSTLFGTYQTT